jgi:predicted DNA-binding WGR domain protein
LTPASGINSYYALQLLEPDAGKTGKFKLFRKWGRVGTTFGGHKVEDYEDEEEALDAFEDLYFEKTGYGLPPPSSLPLFWSLLLHFLSSSSLPCFSLPFHISYLQQQQLV